MPSQGGVRWGVVLKSGVVCEGAVLVWMLLSRPYSADDADDAVATVSVRIKECTVSGQIVNSSVVVIWIVARWQQQAHVVIM